MSSDAPCTVDEAVEWLREHFDAEPARGIRVVYGMDLSGPSGGGITLRVADGSLDVFPELAAEVDICFRMSAADYYAVLAGHENPDLLYMAGRIEIEGDHSRALKIRTLFHAG